MSLSIIYDVFLYSESIIAFSWILIHFHELLIIDFLINDEAWLKFLFFQTWWKSVQMRIRTRDFLAEAASALPTGLSWTYLTNTIHETYPETLKTSALICKSATQNQRFLYLWFILCSWFTYQTRCYNHCSFWVNYIPAVFVQDISFGRAIAGFS